MVAMIAILQEYWIQLVTTIAVGVIAIFGKKIAEWITLKVRVLITNIKKAFHMKLTCPVPGIQEALNAIKAELHPNGGGSLRDAVNRIEKKVQSIDSATKKLHVSHEVLTEIVDVPFFRADASGNTTYCSGALCRLAGMTSSIEYMGMNWVSFVHPEDARRVKTLWQEAIADKRTFLGEFKIVNPYNGRMFLISEKATPVIDDNGSVLGWEGVIMKYDEIFPQLLTS